MEIAVKRSDPWLKDIVLSKYMTQVVKDSRKPNVDYREVCSTLLVLAEGYHLLSNDQNIDELIYQNMLMLKETVMENKLLGRPSLFEGLTEIALSILAVNRVTGNYKKFLDKINQLLYQWIGDFIQPMDIQQNLSADHYDTIYGISGILKYLLLIEPDDSELLVKLLSILVNLSRGEEKDVGILPRWHIKKENLKLESDRLNYPSGYINLGLAHGIAGPLVVLSESYGKGIIVDGHLEAIDRIVEIYKKFAYQINGSTYWPNFLSPELYLNGKGTIHWQRYRESWCYGAIGIAKALFTAGICIGDFKLSDWAFGVIEQKAQLGTDELMLDSPTLCHGFAGVLSILNSTHHVRQSPILQSGMFQMEQLIAEMHDTNSLYGFWNIESLGNQGKIKSDKNIFLDGAAGVILALLSSNGYGGNFYLNKLML